MIYTFSCFTEKMPPFQAIFHSLDVWHKAAKISKKLAEVRWCLLVYKCTLQRSVILQAASKKSCKEIQPWIPAIRNHFWWVCSSIDIIRGTGMETCHVSALPAKIFNEHSVLSRFHCVYHGSPFSPLFQKLASLLM